MRRVSHGFLDELVSQATSSPRLRQHFNLHHSYDEPCQMLFNAIGANSYVRPHRHSRDPYPEMLFAVRGRFAALKFGDMGEILEVVHFSCVPPRGGEKEAICVEVGPEDWHTVVAGEDGSVLLEVKAGPFDPTCAKEFARWAPREGATSSADYLEVLRRAAFSKLRKV